MATTTNYGWTTPDDTALVKDGAAAIRTLGSSVDTTTKALNPETTLGDIAYRSSTANVKTRLGIGSTGQVLTVAGGVPSWATPGGGPGLVLIDEVGFTASTGVNVNDVFSSTYNNYRIILVGTVSPATVSMRLRVSGSDTSTGYEYVRLYVSSGSVGTDADVVGNDEFFLGSFDNTSQSIQVYDLSSPNEVQETSIYGGGGSAPGNTININYGSQTDTTQFTGFSILCANGMTGKVSIYGYAKE
jgi:hypothetical protein